MYDKSKWPEWLKNADTQNAQIEVVDDGSIVWHGGVWRGGVWHGGVWHGGVWHGGVWHGDNRTSLEKQKETTK